MKTNRLIENAKTSQFTLPLVLIPVVAIGIGLLGDILGGNLSIFLIEKLQVRGMARSCLQLASVGLNALLIFAWIRFVECRKIQSMGLAIKGSGKDIAIGAGTGFVTFTLMVVISVLLGTVTIKYTDLSFRNIASVLLMIPFWIIQAGTEEILTRGWILPEMSAKSNAFVGITVSSLVFVLMHIDNAGLNLLAVINIFLIGVLLGIYTLKSENLLGAIFFHAFWNFTQGSFFGLSVSGGSAMEPSLFGSFSKGNLLLSGGTFGPEASVITTILIVLLLAAVIVYPKKEIG